MWWQFVLEGQERDGAVGDLVDEVDDVLSPIWLLSQLHVVQLASSSLFRSCPILGASQLRRLCLHGTIDEPI